MAKKRRQLQPPNGRASWVRWSAIVAAIPVFAAVVTIVVNITDLGGKVKSVSTPTSTQQHHFIPFDDKGHVSTDLQIGPRFSGTCFTNSLIISQSRGDAIRCENNRNELFDPCFGEGTTQMAICETGDGPRAPAIQLTLTQPLPPELPVTDVAAGSSSASPWFLYLSNGAKCEMLSTSQIQVGGQTVQYRCNDGDVVGTIDRSQQMWHAQYVREGQQESQNVDVRDAYF